MNQTDPIYCNFIFQLNYMLNFLVSLLYVDLCHYALIKSILLVNVFNDDYGSFEEVNIIEKYVELIRMERPKLAT